MIVRIYRLRWSIVRENSQIQISSGTRNVPPGNLKIPLKIEKFSWKINSAAEKIKDLLKIQKFRWKNKFSAGDLKIPPKNKISN